MRWSENTHNVRRKPLPDYWRKKARSWTAEGRGYGSERRSDTKTGQKAGLEVRQK